jgi:hypothetical protein
MLPSGLVLAGNSLLNSTDGNNVDSSDVIMIPSTPAAFLAGIDADGRIASMQMIALAPGGSGGTIVSIPIGSAAVVAEGEQPRRVVDSYASGGLDALVTDVEVHDSPLARIASDHLPLTACLHLAAAATGGDAARAAA